MIYWPFRYMIRRDLVVEVWDFPTALDVVEYHIYVLIPIIELFQEMYHPRRNYR